jgi:hypothetical protein
VEAVAFAVRYWPDEQPGGDDCETQEPELDKRYPLLQFKLENGLVVRQDTQLTSGPDKKNKNRRNKGNL